MFPTIFISMHEILIILIWMMASWFWESHSRRASIAHRITRTDSPLQQRILDSQLSRSPLYSTCSLYNFGTQSSQRIRWTCRRVCGTSLSWSWKKRNRNRNRRDPRLTAKATCWTSLFAGFLLMSLHSCRPPSISLQILNISRLVFIGNLHLVFTCMDLYYFQLHLNFISIIGNGLGRTGRNRFQN